MKVKEYLFIKKASLLEFNILINEYLNNGWELYGNSMMVYDNEYEDCIMGQALVIYENK